MVRGIKFEVPNTWYPVIYLILKAINIDEFFWYLASEDVMGDHRDYFDKYKYAGTEFKKVIQEKDCYAISINLQAYLNENDIVEIHSYGDYQESQCKLLLLIDDNSYIMLYAKEQEILEAIHNDVELNGFENIKYITDENDKRNLNWL